ncbi:MAG: hypothetical protein SNJ75_07040, partial [Gemmataceae bacterium]
KQGEVFVQAGQTWQITYQGGDGNDVVVRVIDPAAPNLNGTPGDDTFLVIRNGANLETYLNGNLIDTRPFTSLTGAFTLNGLGGNDTLIVDLSGGDAVPAGNIFWNGGVGGNDSLILTGGTTQGVTTFNYTNANDGNIVMSNFGTVFYTGLEPITNSGTITDAIFNLPVTGSLATLGDDGTTGNGLLRLSSSPVTFETTDFTAPTGSLTVNRGNVADTLSVANLTDFVASANLTIGSSGNNFASVTFSGPATVAGLTVYGTTISNTASAALTVTGNASFTGTTVTLGTLAGDVMNFGSLTFNSGGAVTIEEDSATELTATSTANSLVLSSSGAISNTASAALTVTGNASFTGTTVTLGTLAGDVMNFGSLTVSATGAVTVEEDSDMAVNTVSGTAVLLRSTGAISDTNGAALNITGSTVLLQAATGIGSSSDPLEIDAGTLAFVNSTSGDVFIRHVGSGVLTVDDIGSVTASSNNGTGQINLFANNGLVINHDLSTTPAPATGTLTIGGGVTFNAAITVGQGNITLDGNGDDIVISGPTSFNVNTTLNPNRDILVNANLSTTGTANLGLFAGKGYSGVGAGGVYVTAGASVTSAGDLTILGKDLFVTSSGTPDSVLINGSVSAAGTLTIGVNTVGGPAPANARTILNGPVSNTTGDISISAVEAIELNTTVSSTAGTVSFNSPVLLTGTSSVTNNGTISFASTVNGANDLSVDAGSGTTTFQGAIGNSTPIGDGSGAALTVAGGAATFNGTVQTASGIVQVATAGLVTFNEDVTVNGGNTASSFAGNVTLDGLTFQTIDQDASFTGSTLTLAGGSSGVTLRVGGTNAHTITVAAQVVGPASTPLQIWTNPASAVILSNANNTYAGATNIDNGRLTVTGTLAAGGGTVTLVGPQTVLGGSGTIDQRPVVVASTATDAKIVGITLSGPGTSSSSVGLTVNSSRAFLGGSSSGDPITVSGWGTGVLVNGASAAAVINGVSASNLSVLTGNRIGVDVNAGKAWIQLTDLSNNSSGGSDGISAPAGLRVRNNARVDAGQGFGGYDFTDLNGGGVGQGSTGGNVFNGYTAYTGNTVPTVPQAILNLSNTGLNAVAGPQGAPTDVYAQYNSFNGSTALADIEPLVWHDYDASARGFVNYARPSSLTPTLVGGVRLLAGTDSVLQTNSYTQASMARLARVSFDNYVSIGSSAMTVQRVGSAFNDTAIDTSVTTISSQVGSIFFNPFAPDGRYFNYDLTFSGPGVELSGSLQDGEYTLSFDVSKVQSFVNLNFLNIPALQGGSGISTLAFHRLFGDANGDKKVDATDKALFDAAMRSRQGMSNFREYFNFDWNRVIDLQDQTAFNRRFNRY